MNRESWEWDHNNDDGYNYVAALECTLINFKLMTSDDACSSDECVRFSKKYKYAQVRELTKGLTELKSTICALTELVDDQQSQIYNLRREVEKEVDSINDDFRELKNDLSQDINQLEGSINSVSDSVSNSLDDFGSEIVDIKHDLEKVINEVDDITSNLADRVLLD